MKIKLVCYRTIAMLLCVITLSLSVGGKFCYYNDLSKTYAADSFSLTMGGLAIEEIIMSIAVAILGYETAYEYRDELINSFKNSIGSGAEVDAGKILFEAYNGKTDELYTYTWDAIQEILENMGSSASASFEDFKDSFADTYIRPSKEYLQYVAEFWGDFITENTMPNYEAVTESTYYIAGLSEIMQQQYITSDDVWKIISTSEPFHYKGTMHYEYDYTSSTDSRYNRHVFNIYSFDFISKDRISCYSYSTLRNDGSISHDVGFYGKVGSENWRWYNLPLTYNFFSTNALVESVAGETTKISIYYVDGGTNSEYEEHNLIFSESVNIPMFSNSDDALAFAKTGQGIENALNYSSSLSDIAITGDDIPTVGNWEDLWERLKNPDLPWWWGNTDSLANQEALPWFDISGLYEWANDIPDITDDVIANNPDIPWSDVFDKVIDIPDVIIPDIDFPYNPSIPTDPSIPADPSIPTVSDPTVDIPLDLTDELTEMSDYVPTIADSFGDLGNEMKTKFPFSIPWDIYYILNGLATAPKAPRFELPLKVEHYGIDETIEVDMTRFQVLSDLSRSIFSMLFMIGLINLTIKVIGSFKEES